MSDSSSSESEGVEPSWEQTPASEAGDIELELRTAVAPATDGNYDDFIEPFPEKPPEYGKDGLIVLWGPAYKDASTSGLGPGMVPDFDIVVIHGLHGARRPPWKNPGSGDSSWLDGVGRQDGRKVMAFGYDATKLLAGNQTRQAIRKAAVRLLEDLRSERLKSEIKRPIMFIAHDLGGIILKDALTVAGLDPKLYNDIFDYTRLLVFYGCPHRARSYMDMEDRLSRFVFCNAKEDTPKIAAAVSSIRGLASAVVDINNLFLDSKHTFRSYVVSVFAGKADCSIDSAFDNFTATLSVPFEIRLAGRVSALEEGDFFESHLLRIQHQIVPNTATLQHERALLSVAAPAPILSTADEPDHRFSWITQNEVYKSWFNQKRPQLLYVHGTTGVQEASEYIFYDLDQIHFKRNSEIVLYFRFNNWDLRRAVIRDMLAYFLAQIIGHFPSLAEFVTNQFERLNLDRSWNDFDLLNWFEYYRLRGEVDGISCVLANFDECPPESRMAFLGLFSYIAGVHERPWRVIVTSKVRGALSDELSEFDWPTIDLDAVLPPPSTIVTADFTDRRPEISDLVVSRPERSGFVDRLEEELGTIDGLRPIAKHVVIQHMCAQADWPEKQSIETTLGAVSEMSLEEILEKILSRAPDKQFAFRALSWIIYSTRPPTLWEMACVMLSGTSNELVSPPNEFVVEVMEKITAWLGGIVVVEQHEYHIPTSRLRSILASKPDKEKGPKYPWEKFATTGHAGIAKVCLDYLAREEVKQHLSKMYSGSDVMELPTHCDRTNLCDYAIQFWMHHLSWVPTSGDLDPRGELESFLLTDAVPVWSKAYWALANVITRSPTYFESVYPLLAGVGMAELADSLRRSDGDISAGLVEACLNGHPGVVQDLLPRVEHSISSLQDALIAAGSNGNEDTWIELIRHISSKHKEFPWPTSLVNRAAWLGLDKAVSTLLDLGCPVDPEDSIQMDMPLHLVARTGHSKVLQILLEHGADVQRLGKYHRTALHVTAGFGHAKCAILLAKAGIDLDAKDDQNMTAVYMASLWGNFMVVQTLLELGADPNIGDSDDPKKPGWYPLVVAAEEKNVECARALLEGGADPNIQGRGGTPLRYAALNGLSHLCSLLLDKGADPNHPSVNPPILTQMVLGRDRPNRFEIVKILVENQANVNHAQPDGTTALWWASFAEDEEDMLPIVAYLIDRGAALDKPNTHGATPLNMAVRRGNVDTVRLLLSKGANPNTITDHRSMISWAVQNAEITRLLLENGADANNITSSQNSPLVYAVMGNWVESARLLLQNKARPDPTANIPDARDWTALALAAAWGYPDLVRLLGDFGADVNYRVPSTGRSIVHIAFSSGTDKTATLPALLEFCPDVNVADQMGDAPLHETAAPHQTSLESVKLLVRAGADLHLRNAAGLTPLACAVRERHTDAAKFMLSRGADVNAASPAVGGPLHLACKNGMLSLVRDLIAAGADVNLGVPGRAGTPLVSTLLGYDPSSSHEDLPADDLEEDHRDEAGDDLRSIASLLLQHGADATADSGRLGSAASAAALRAPVQMLRWVLGKGASATSSDSMGRQAVHIAALRGSEHLSVVLGTGGDALTRDLAGRTALHWAAQGCNLEAVETVMGLTGDEAVDQPDVTGWTPLCWAARGGGPDGSMMGTEKQAAVIEELLKRGADKEAKGRVGGGKMLTPFEIANYHSASNEILGLLTTDGRTEKSNGGIAKEQGDIPRGTREVKHVQHVREQQLTTWLGHVCDYCLYTPQGFRYKCKTCADLDLCYKCYESRDGLHPTGHLFEEIGPEFDETSQASDSSSIKSSPSITESSIESEATEDGGNR